MISEKVAFPKIGDFYASLRVSKMGAANHFASCSVSCDFAALTICSFWVDLFSPSVDVQEIEAQRGNNSMTASVGRIHFSIPRFFRIVSSATLLRFFSVAALPLFFFRPSGSLFESNLQKLSTHKGREFVTTAARFTFSTRGQLNNCRPVVVFCSSFFFCHHLVCRGS